MSYLLEQQNLSDFRFSIENSANAIKDSLQNFANLPGFDEQMMLAFGNEINVDLFEADWQTENFTFPNIEVVSNNTINGSNGAFSIDTNTIYLSAEFLTANQSNLDVVNSVLLEEYGHYIDSQINSVDTSGDEGAIFSAIVRGEKLTDSDLQQLRNEDDSAVVNIDGEEIAIEQASTNLIDGLGGSAGFGENSLARNDDESTDFVDITPIFEDGFNFFGTNYQNIYINNNGNITFNSPLSEFTPFAITGNTGQPIIAPFFADVDTTAGNLQTSPGGNSTGSNLVYWDFNSETDSVIITWDDVGRYEVEDDESEEAEDDTGGEVPNAFQLILRDLGNGNSEIEFRYEEVRWTVGTASENNFARLGYSAADGVNFLELSQSGNNQQLLSLETATNIEEPGRFVFSVIDGIPNESPVANPDTVDPNTGNPLMVNVGESIVIDILANDTDPDEDDEINIVNLDGSPFYGDATIVTVNGRQQIEYTPDPNSLSADSRIANQRDNFGYIVTDGTDTARVGTPGIIIEINQLYAEDDSISSLDLQPNNPVNIDVLDNDFDADGDNFSIDSVDNPVFGTAQIVDNQITYTPNNNFTGADSFQYTIKDDRGATDTAIINISPEPIVTFDSLVIDGVEGTTQTVTLKRTGDLNLETTVELSFIPLDLLLSNNSSNGFSRFVNSAEAINTITTGLKNGITNLIGSIVGFPSDLVPSTASKVFGLMSKVIVPLDILQSGITQAQANANDIQLSQTSITFDPGQDTKTVSLEYVQDNEPEGDQIFYLELSSLQNPQALGVIRDDDRQLPGINFNDPNDVLDLTVNTIAGGIVGAIFGAINGGIVGGVAGGVATGVFAGLLTELAEILEDNWQQSNVDRQVSGFNSISEQINGNSTNNNSLNANSYGFNFGSQESEILEANEGGTEIKGFGGNTISL